MQHQLAQPHQRHCGSGHHLIKQTGDQRIGQQQCQQEETRAHAGDDPVPRVHVGLGFIHALGFKIIVPRGLEGAGQHIGEQRGVVCFRELVKVDGLALGHLVVVPHIHRAEEFGCEPLAAGNLSANLGHVHGRRLVHAAVGQAKLEHAETQNGNSENPAHGQQPVALIAFFAGECIH